MTERTTRSKKSTNSTEVDTCFNALSKRVFFINDNLLETGQDIKVERLRHPGTGEAAYYILHKPNKKIYEILQFNEPHRSWLIGESVSSNGKCFLTVPTDPLFFALFYLHKECSDQAIPLTQIQDAEFPLISEVLEDYIDENMLLKISDRKGPADYKAYKINNEKTLAWLAIKTKNLSNLLKLKKIHVGDSAISANYKKDETDETINEDEYLRYAIGIIDNYLPEKFYEELLNYFNVKQEEIVQVKRKNVPLTGEPLPKKIKIEEPSVVVVETPKEKKVSAKMKALTKAASGTKSIASFFKK